MSAPFTFVVVVYHRTEPLTRLLTGVCASQPEACPRIVVVNKEDDPDVRRVAESFGATVIAAPDDGYAAGVNRGVEEVDTEITVFSSDDLEVTTESLHRLVTTVAAGVSDVAVPQILDLDGHVQGSVRALPTPGRLFVEWAATVDRPLARTGHIQKWRRPRVTERVDAFDAALVAVRTNVVREHPLPEEYFLYWEEMDWCYRLHAVGRQSVLVPDAVVRHAGGRDDVRPDKQRLLARNAVRCVYRTQGRAAALRAWPVVVLWQLRLLVVDVVRAVLGRENRVPARVAGVTAAARAWHEAVPDERPRTAA
jgi:GT2 family glycosyltransferase